MLYLYLQPVRIIELFSIIDNILHEEKESLFIYFLEKIEKR